MQAVVLFLNHNDEDPTKRRKLAGVRRYAAAARWDVVAVDLLVQAPGAYWVVEIKRRKRIGREIEREVRDKIEALPVPRGVSVRACLIFLGELDPAVEESGFFSAIVPAEAVLRSRKMCFSDR